MSRRSRTTFIIVAGLLMVGCHSNNSSPSASQVSSHSPATGEAGTSPLSASPFPVEGEDTATLAAGRYVTSNPFPVPVSVTVPAGWISELPGPYAVFLSTADGAGSDGPAALALLLSPLVSTDPCKDVFPDSPPATVDDFVTAVAALHDLTVTGPKDVTLGGLQGKQLTLTVPAVNARCSYDPVVALPLGHEFGLYADETMSLTALDDHGVLLVVEEKTTPQATAPDRAQLAAALASMSIGKST